MPTEAVTGISPENKGYCENSCHFLFSKTSPELFSEKEFQPLDPTQELIFPPELMVRKALAHLEELMVRCQEGPFQNLTEQLSDLLRDTVQGRAVKADSHSLSKCGE